MSESNERVVLILEKSSAPIEILDKKDFSMTGNAAVFGKENENHRIYEEDEYFLHLDYLQDKIKKRKLVGEMDHPERFDTSLKNISHIVEKLWYDKDSRTMKCNLRILDTDPHGLNARKLVEAGFPLSLSSRAAGVVGKDKRVKIKRIFAYDLVADGGFGDEAELARVNESLTKFSLDYYNTKNLTMINEELGIDSDTLEIYDVTDTYPDLLTEDADFSVLEKDETNNDFSSIYNKNNNTVMNQTVTVEEMYKYSKVVKEKMEEMSEEITSLKKLFKVFEETNNSGAGDPGNGASADVLAGAEGDLGMEDPEIEKVKSQITELQESQKHSLAKLEKLIEYSEMIAKQSNSSLDYSEELAEHIQANRDYSEKIGEMLNDDINYTEKLGDILNKSINYSERTAETVNYIANHNDEIVEHLNNVINFSDVLSESLNKVINYADYLGENQNVVINYSEYLAKNSVVKEDFDQFIQYTEEMVGAGEGKAAVMKEEASKPEINEEINENKSVFENYKTLGEKIEKVLESINTPEIVETKTYDFIESFNENEVERFESLSEAQKTKVEELITKEEKLEESRVDEILNEIENPVFPFIDKMPEQYKISWEKLSEDKKGAIIRRSQFYNLETDYQIRNFWRNQKLEAFESTLNENKQVKVEKEEKINPKLGYSKNLVSSIGKSLDNLS